MIHLREIRTDKNLSLRQLEEKSGINRSRLSKIERGILKPENITVGTIQKLAKSLGVKCNELIDLD